MQARIVDKIVLRRCIQPHKYRGLSPSKPRRLAAEAPRGCGVFASADARSVEPHSLRRTHGRDKQPLGPAPNGPTCLGWSGAVRFANEAVIAVQHSQGSHRRKPSFRALLRINKTRTTKSPISFSLSLLNPGICSSYSLGSLSV